ncbi:MAG: PLP-dependent aminotransferase family protein [Actinomycetales bacterium]|nr:PLP-dependent aminotransferase family protein [Actinomycetales bacterium]
MPTVSSRALAALLGGWRAGSAAPAYRALADRIRLLALDGRLSLGQRLPAERDLAAQLALSRTTVSAAYAELREAGYLESRRGSGSIVRLPHQPSGDDAPIAGGLLDLGKAAPPALPAVADAAARAAAALPGFLGETGFDPLGLTVVRQAVADRYTARGLPTEADEIMITSGAQVALALLARTLLQRGDRVLVENPSYPHALEALRLAGARFVPIPITVDDGWDTGAIEQAFPRTSPALAYLQPDNQNPTARTMSAALRARVAELAAREGTVLVVDETIAELHLDGRPEPLPWPAAHGPAILLGSTGKTVWGGLRLGWIRADRDVIQRLALARFVTDLGTPVLEQLILRELLPQMDALLAARREYLRTTRDLLGRRLREKLPTWRVPRNEGGMTMWVGLGEPLSSALSLAARDRGVLLPPGPRFGVDGGQFERFLRIPYTSAELIEPGVEALAAAWGDVLHGPLAESEAEFAQVV